MEKIVKVKRRERAVSIFCFLVYIVVFLSIQLFVFFINNLSVAVTGNQFSKQQ